MAQTGKTRGSPAQDWRSVRVEPSEMLHPSRSVVTVTPSRHRRAVAPRSSLRRHESSLSRRPFRFAPSCCHAVRVAPSVPSRVVAPSSPSLRRAIVALSPSLRRAVVIVAPLSSSSRRHGPSLSVAPSPSRRRVVAPSEARRRRAVVMPSSRRRHRRAVVTVVPSRSRAVVVAGRHAHARRGAGRRALRSRVAARRTRAQT
jgi:hypothetical protein